MHSKEKLLRKISELDFAIIDFHLFLDTHPDDFAAEKKLEDYKKESAELREKYEEKYGPINIQSASGWPWIASKWPWELEEREVC
jgi:spore coat protein JB